MLAVFTGKDGSMGFGKGHVYNIKTVCKYNLIYLHEKSRMWCPYESLEAILKNWKILKM